MKIVCLGDSHTYALGVGRPFIWTNLAQKQLGVPVINKGISGDTSGGMLSRFQRDVLDEKPNIVFFMGGTNDFIVGCSAGVVRANMMSLIHQAYFHRIIPWIGIPFCLDIEHLRQDWASFSDFGKVKSELEAYRVWLKKCCYTFGARYIDFYEEYSKRMELSGMLHYFSDGIHPVKEGQKIICDIFCESVQYFIEK